MATNVELYEALKSHVGEEAAGMIAEIVPPAKNIATTMDVFSAKTDVQAEIRAAKDEVQDEIRAAKDEVQADIRALEVRTTALEVKVAESEARLAQKLLAYSIPIWATVASMAVAIVGLLITRS